MPVSIESPAGNAPHLPPSGAAGSVGVDHCIVRRADGVYADPGVLSTTFTAAIDGIFSSDSYLVELDYTVLQHMLYGTGPDGRRAAGDMLRLAAAVAPFDPQRRQLYKAVKLGGGQAEYYFEPVVMTDPADPDGFGVPATLSVDEFVADMWSKGVRFGIDIDAVRRAIDSGKAERTTVARRLEPVAGIDAHIVEVSSDLHRSDAPRQLANGKLDLMAFQNRFPQIRQGVRLLKKVPRTDGEKGFELNGQAIVPAPGREVELSPLAGPGTEVALTPDGEFLVSNQAGFLNVDSKTHQLSVGDKIVSRDGVSSRTTGNLQLTGDYEEFGEVQEKRVIEGEGITIHADVFGNIVSRGGTITLNSNLVGGSAHNARGDIRIKGVASGAVVQTSVGEVVMQRAESCVISGTRVTIEHAANCEIMADEVIIGVAEGCAIGARKVTIETGGPRKQAEMQIFALQPDSARIDEAILSMQEKVAQFARQLSARRAELEALTGQPDVRKYVMLASKVRKKELTLTAEQLPQFQKMATAVGPALKAIAKVSLDVKAAETEQQAAIDLVGHLQQERKECVGASTVLVQTVSGDTTLRSITYQPDGSTLYDLPSKDIKARLRTTTEGSEIVLTAEEGRIEWRSA